MFKDNHSGPAVLGLFMAVGLAVAGYFVSQTLYNAKVALNTAEVKGLAERRVEADQASWKIRYRASGSSRDDVPRLYEQAEKDQQTIIALLKENSLTDDEIEIGVLDYKYQAFRDDQNKLVDQIHSLVGVISIETDKVKEIGAIRAKVNKLIAQGINIENEAPAYRFTRLNDIKPDMLREATTNARIAAGEFAENAGVKVGSIRSALQGGFSVRDIGEDYGDTAKIEKEVRVVTTITFYLTD